MLCLYQYFRYCVLRISIYIYIYICVCVCVCVCVEMVDCGDSDKMLKINGNTDKSLTKGLVVVTFQSFIPRISSD